MKLLPLYALVLSLLLSPGAGAEETAWSAAPWRAVFPYTFSAAPSIGILLGQAEEIVYYSAGDGKLSQLLWDIMPLVYVGLSLDFSPINPWERWGFFGDLDLKYGFPMKIGNMEDRDWQDPSNRGALSAYSSHDAYGKGAFLLDLALGVTVPFRLLELIPTVSKLRLKGFLDFSMMYHSWSGENGKGEYSWDGYTQTWLPTPQKHSFYGPVITYVQAWYILTPGIGLEIPFLTRFSGELSCMISPLVWCQDQDHHITRDLLFIDTMFLGLFLDIGAKITFTPHPRFALSLSGSWRYIPGVRGDTTDYTTGIYDPSVSPDIRSSSDVAGASYNVGDIGLSAMIRF